MPRLTLPTVCAVQGRSCHATTDVIGVCVISKGGDGISRPMSFDRVYRPWAIMACLARHRLIVCAALRR